MFCPTPAAMLATMSQHVEIPSLNWSELSLSELLPTGTVTLLLSDVEGSTRLWETQPEQMTAVLALLNQTVNAALAAHGGVRPLEQGEGDSFVAAFARASDAVLAARDAQRALHAESWPTPGPLRVRMAVHSGEARVVDDGNYAGQAIIRAARLRSIAYGGQVLLSAAARDLTVDQLGDAVGLIDLGERSPEVLYNAGLMFEKAGQLDKAARLYRDALAQQPDMPEALLNLGRIMESNGKTEEARNCWSKALEAEPALAQGYFGPAID